MVGTGPVTAVCPHCDRKGEHDDELTARAWLYAHIREMHPAELAPIEGTE